jgi:hypothetical protein
VQFFGPLEMHQQMHAFDAWVYPIRIANNNGMPLGQEPPM